MKLVIVDYSAGNTCSVVFALNRLGIEPVISADAAVIRAADKVILPGVGAAGSAMQSLRENGLDDVLRSLQQPMLGICLGMQLLCTASDEDAAPCLGILGGQVQKLDAPKIPHMGWNDVHNLRGDLFKGLPENSYLYFVHSYAVPLNAATTATAAYGQSFSAAVQIDNFYGVQFHPEKSGDNGLLILKNFLNL